MVKKLNIPKDNNIVKIAIEEAMPDNYLPYAVEVAKDRALPDVRDGLKPVQRRILYGAYLLKATPDKPYYKSARIVGDILGKFHPHGDASVYDAMVILAQDFTTRMPLIDGHGNWGSIDGDSAAAMRYTEARLTKIAMEMVRDLDKNVVDMVENYSGTEMEPKVLPSRYPNLLVNGAFGIAVGLATNIPPHNLREVIDAALAYIDNHDIDTKGLMKYIKGPDLPTGGVLIGKNALLSAYETGEGRVSLRAKADIEKLESGRLGIVIKEFPYRRSKAKLLQIISDMTGDKKHSKAMESIMDIRDESDRTGIRAVIELKKSADYETAEKLLKYLYKKTDLQCNIIFNMVALSDGKPETMGLKTIIKNYVEHQKEVVTRRTKTELDTAKKRFHIVEGFIKAIDIMDDIIKTIRASKSKSDAENNLQKQFGFSPAQAQAIVELMLYRLTGLEIKTFEKEYKELEKLINRLEKILSDEKVLLKVIKTELSEIKDKYGDDRKTEVIENDDEAKIDIEELVVVEDIMVTISNDGYIKRIPLKSYNRSNTNVEDIEYREGDYNKFLFTSNTLNTVMMFTDKGNMYQLKGNLIPEYRWKEKGERLDTLIRAIDLSSEKIVSVYSVENVSAQMDFVFFTAKGYIKKTSLDKFNTSYSKIQALKLKENDRLVDAKLTENNRETRFIKFNTRYKLQFSIEEPELEPLDRAVMGTQLFSLPGSDEVISAEFTDEYEYKVFYVSITKEKYLKVSPDKPESEDKIILTKSNESIIIFTTDGLAYKIPSYMIQNIGDEGINTEDILINTEGTKSELLNMISVSDFNDEMDIYFFTRYGLVKRTMLKEFDGAYSAITAYKLKNNKDRVISVQFQYSGTESKAVMITRRAMCIKFDTSGINYMGRVASGVTGISLKEDDSVVYSAMIPAFGKENRPMKKLGIKSLRGAVKTIDINKIKIQNRAGRGTNVMLVVFDDYIVETFEK